ncbi:MAG: IclR family transcriptional regulator [Symbiopectobacterium sp.]|uniref:IclR family transcriptional regulator n=1 Tax=Symbiopectobacterium sp. TaxID=2952789 RepID=UPI0039E8697F
MNNAKTKVPAIDKMILLLDYLSTRNVATFTEIHNALSLPKSSLSLMLASLVTHRLVKFEKNKYHLGLKMYEYGSAAIQNFNVKSVAHTILSDLVNQLNLTCHLGVLDGDSPIYLDKIESNQLISIKSVVGKKLSLHSSGLSKTLISQLSDAELDRLLPEENLEIFTPMTIPTKTALKKELQAIRKSGYAFDSEEGDLGIFCIAMPIFDGNHDIIAGVSVTGVTFQMPETRHEEIIHQLREACQKISRKLYE